MDEVRELNDEEKAEAFELGVAALTVAHYAEVIGEMSNETLEFIRHLGSVADKLSAKEWREFSYIFECSQKSVQGFGEMIKQCQATLNNHQKNEEN